MLKCQFPASKDVMSSANIQTQKKQNTHTCDVRAY